MTRPAADDVEDQAVVVGLTRDEVRAALHAVEKLAQVLARSSTAGVPRHLASAQRRLWAAHRRAVSPTRQSAGPPQPHSEAWIGTGQAAELLGMEHRTVQRRAADLDGQKVNGRWWFPAATIRDIAQHKGINEWHTN